MPGLELKIMYKSLIFIEKQVYKNVAHFGNDDAVVRFEILDASKVVDRTREMHFSLAGA